MASSSVNNPTKTESDNLVPKLEPLESLPDPQPRNPIASLEHYRSIIGPGHKIVCKRPKNERDFWPPIKRKPNERSQYDERMWPELKHPKDEQLNKKDSKERFLLNDNEMADLAYIVGPPKWGSYQDHLYLAIEAERRAWEIYGGPEGLQSAIDEHDRAVRQRPKRTRKRRSTVSATPSNRYAPYTIPFYPFDMVPARVGSTCPFCDE